MIIKTTDKFPKLSCHPWNFKDHYNTVEGRLKYPIGNAVMYVLSFKHLFITTGQICRVL